MDRSYISTRGSTAPVSFAEALLQGLAPDGGLFVPTNVPPLPDGWRDAPSFSALAEAVLTPWLQGEVLPEVSRRIIREALDLKVPVVALQGAGWEGVHVLELFHGPTLSFKDFGARTMARLMQHFLAEKEEALTILVATSGDTGSAVADGFAGQEAVNVVLLYPKGQVSAVQERQLITQRPGVQTFAVEGTFDDCQRLVKAAFQNADRFQQKLSSANSINIGRLLPQMLYYIWAVREGGFKEMVCCVPSGNLGNMTGGMLAYLGGLPVRQFIAAHNANDGFPLFLGGAGDPVGNSIRTLSNAMDVGAPSNFERLTHLLSTDELRALVWGTSVSDEETVASMRRVYEATGYVADPHTAVGLEAVRRYREQTGDLAPAVVASTAHPAKFPDVVKQALGIVPETPERLAKLWEAPTQVRPLLPTLEALQTELDQLANFDW